MNKESLDNPEKPKKVKIMKKKTILFLSLALVVVLLPGAQSAMSGVNVGVDTIEQPAPRSVLSSDYSFNFENMTPEIQASKSFADYSDKTNIQELHITISQQNKSAKVIPLKGQSLKPVRRL